MTDHLLNTDYSSCLYCTDVELVWCNLRSIINDAICPYGHQKEPPQVVQPSCTASYKLCPFYSKEDYAPSATNILKLAKAEQNLCSGMVVAKSSYEAKLVDEFAFNSNNKIYINSILRKTIIFPYQCATMNILSHLIRTKRLSSTHFLISLL